MRTSTGAPLGKRAAMRVLGWPSITRALRDIASARGHRLVLVYHGIAGTPAGALAPSIAPDLFRAHLRALTEVADVVSLTELLTELPTDPRKASGGERRRPVVAVTLDDDLPSHVSEALPALREARVPAAFFLSGRALAGLGSYWFHQLESLVDVYGYQRTAALLGLESTPGDQLAVVCERNRELRRRVAEAADGIETPKTLDRDGIVALANAGMTIGFHTVDHEVLPALSGAALDEAITAGRDRLAAAVNAPLRYFAYPHGQADSRSAAAVRRAGFDAAFIGRSEPVRRGSDRYQLGRWDAGPLSVDDFLVRLAVRLHRAERAPRVVS